MKKSTPIDTLDEVLDSFAIEADHGRETLESYLRDYPEYAQEILDLSTTLSEPIREDVHPLSAEDQALIEATLAKHLFSRAPAIVDPFATLTVDNLRRIAKDLGVPRQIVSAFRERKVKAVSIPRPFLGSFAKMLGLTNDRFAAFLDTRSLQSPVHSHKSDTKPADREPVSFEQLLIDADISKDDRTKLMEDDG